MQRTTLHIFSVALGARVALSALQIIVGIRSIPWIPSLGMWSDFYDIYGIQLMHLKQGLIPYSGFGYSFTPLFLYMLYPFYVVGNVQLASVPIILADALSACLVYKITDREANGKVALAAGMAYALSPLPLVEEGYLWMSTQPMLFLLLLALWFLRKGNGKLSVLALALSVMTKQESLFILPVYIFFYRRMSGTRMWKAASIFVAVVGAISGPFLLVSPASYLESISYGIVNDFRRVVMRDHATTALVGGNTSHFLQTCNTATTSFTSYACIQYPYPMFTLLINFANWMANLLVFPLFVLVLIALIWDQELRGQMSLWGTYVFCVFLLAFLYLGHTIYAYYLLPPYALLICSAKTFRSVVAVTAFTVISLLIDQLGVVQEFGVVVLMLILMAINNTIETKSRLSS